MKKRVDQFLVEKQLVPSREKARALILAGKVMVDDCLVDKVGKQVAITSHLRVIEKDHPYVSRGGVKLESALKAFQFSSDGLIALDIGASTGGFTHCLLLHGAKHVFAVDVGYGQLAWDLRQNPQVTSLERTNIRYLAFEKIGQLVDLVVIDASFISLKLIFPAVLRFLKPQGHVISLVKPQFEATKTEVGKRGQVKDIAVHEQIQKNVTQEASDQGFQVLQWIESAITGKKSSNKEFFVYFKRK